MHPSRWDRIKSLFFRQDQSVNGADQSLLAQVRRLQEFAKDGSNLPLHIEESGDAEEESNPLADTQIFENGAIVSGRFEIICRLGRGGMGEVYEALDQVNRTTVAFKVLRDDIELSAQANERLIRREFLLSQRIAHPNICRVNDLYVHQNGSRSYFIVSMEFIRGRTLAEIFEERGALPLAEVHAIARQIIAGVAAAHAANIVHRDLKPSNVMIVEGATAVPRVVITDFGLARSDRDTASSLTNFRGFAGTLRYMAPEQIQGESSATSDIYAVGLILYEILTRGFPFSGSTGMAVGLNRLATQPRDPAQFLPNIPLNWRLALLKALERDPKNRFQTITDFAAALEPQQSSALKLHWAAHKLRANAKWAIASLTILCAALAVSLWWSYRPTPPPAFTNLLFAGLSHANSADPVLSATELSFLSSLRQSPHLSVHTTSDTSATFQRMGKTDLAHLTLPELREAALRTGQKALLQGSISSNRGQYRLHLELQSVSGNPSDTAKTVSQNFDAAGSQDMFRSIREAAEWVRKLSGESPRELFEQNVQPADLTTGSWNALHLYQEARLRSETNDRASAIMFLDEALALDPGFAAAESLRGDIFTQMNEYREAIHAHQHALVLVKARNIAGRERFQIETAFNSDVGDTDAEVKTYREWMAHYPNDFLPRFLLAGIYYDRGDFAQALLDMQTAQKLEADNFAIYPHLAAIYLALGQHENALQCAEKLRSLGEPEWAIYVEGLALASQKRFDEAAVKFQTLLVKSDFWDHFGSFCLAEVLASAGRLQESEHVLQDFIRSSQSKDVKAEETVAIAYLHWLNNDSSNVKAMLVPVLSDLDNPETLAEAGSLLARSGDIKSARQAMQLLERWPDVPFKTQARSRLQADLSIAQNPAVARRVAERTDSGRKSPVVLDLLLYAARRASWSVMIRKAQHEITERPSLLFNWGRWGEYVAIPGVFWLASCEQSAERTDQGCATR